MSLPDQIQLKLLGRPARLAGLTGTLRNRRTIASACRPVATPAFTHSLRMFQPGRICGDFELSMSSSRDAFLGHEPVSPLGVEDHSTPIGSDDVQNLFAGSANGHG